MIQPPQIACYLDEADDDPIAACQSIVKNGFYSTILRKVWSSKIEDATDEACRRLMQAISQHKITVVSIDTSIGKCEIDQLVSQKIERSILIASYFKAKHIKISVGTGHIRHSLDEYKIDSWLEIVTKACSELNIKPLIETNNNESLQSVDQFSQILQKHKYLNIQYDPAMLVARKVVDPLEYWTKLRDRILLVDLHDFKTGRSPSKLGFGDCKWSTIRNDLPKSGLVLESGFGRNFGNTYTKQQTFSLAVDGLKAFFDK